MADWKVGRQTLIKCPKLEDIPYCNETLIKEAIQNSNGRKRACPCPEGVGGKSNNKVIGAEEDSSLKGGPRTGRW